MAKTPHFAMHRCALVDANTPTLRNPLFPQENVWLGAMLPKRWAKRSVTRHLIKRQVYAMAQSVALANAAYVVRLRAGFDRQRFISASSQALKQTVRQEMMQLFALTHQAKP